MIEAILGQKEIKRIREFVGLEAYKEDKRLRIIYKETTLINNEVVKIENISYTRDYDQWEAHTLGQSILAMINLDLAKDNPSDLTIIE